MRLIRITGDSMSPALRDGDIVIVKTPRSLRPGRIYIVDHIDLGQIVKRMSGEKNGRYLFAGDNADASTPQGVIAPVERERITGRVVAAIGKTGIRFRL